MAIDDAFEKEVAELEAQLLPSMPKTISRSIAMAFAGITLPGIGPAMLALFTGLAENRNKERLRELLIEMSKRIRAASKRQRAG